MKCTELLAGNFLAECLGTVAMVIKPAAMALSLDCSRSTGRNRNSLGSSVDGPLGKARPIRL
jgi:hypothetical protein